jgi:outer membrane protein OmpA-like peptidoglycan-associated protein
LETKLVLFFSYLIVFYVPFFGQHQLFSEPTRIRLDHTEESAPIYDEINQQLYFVRTFIDNSGIFKYNQDSWKGNFNNQSKSLEVLIPLNEVNNIYNNILCGLSADGKRAYFFHSKGINQKNAGLFVYDRIHGKLSNPKKIVIPGLEITSINTIGFYMHPDEKSLLISYKDQESIGMEDLYLSRFENGQWTVPENLGEAINTTGFEISPFLTKQKDTLFFASNGRVDTFGNSDIYFSVLSKSGEWTTPVNLGPTINTVHFEAYLIQVENGLLWSSNKNGNYTDFYFSQLVPSEPLQIQYAKKDVSTFQGFDGEIALKIQSGNPPYKYQWSNGGLSKELFQLRAGEYSVQVTDSKEQKIQLTIQITQPELPLDSVFHFPEIRYKSDSWEFVNDSTCSSYDSLNQIINTLNHYPSIVLKLISHTDARGDENRNLVLSQNRSRACYRYLVLEKGIDPRRIIPIGLGESSPASYLDPSTGKEELLSEKYLSQYENNSFVLDQLNQLNRRTEGIIDRMNFSNNDPKAPESYLLFLKLP